MINEVQILEVLNVINEVQIISTDIEVQDIINEVHTLRSCILLIRYRFNRRGK